MTTESFTFRLTAPVYEEAYEATTTMLWLASSTLGDLAETPEESTLRFKIGTDLDMFANYVILDISAAETGPYDPIFETMVLQAFLGALIGVRRRNPDEMNAAALISAIDQVVLTIDT